MSDSQFVEIKPKWPHFNWILLITIQIWKNDMKCWHCIAGAFEINETGKNIAVALGKMQVDWICKTNIWY